MTSFLRAASDDCTPAPLICAVRVWGTYRLCELVKLQSSCKKLNLLSELMDHNGDYVHTILPYVLSLLQRGLGQRISLLTHSLSPDPEVGKKLVFINVHAGLLKWWRVHSFQLETKVWKQLDGLLVSLQWSVENEAPKYKSQPPLSFGLLLNPELSTSVLERGPPADSPKVFPTFPSLFISVDISAAVLQHRSIFIIVLEQVT